MKVEIDLDKMFNEDFIDEIIVDKLMLQHVIMQNSEDLFDPEHAEKYLEASKIVLAHFMTSDKFEEFIKRSEEEKRTE